MSLEGHQRVFIVRHGERIDHVDSTYKKKVLRPHDAPLTKKGEDMGRKLGQYLTQERNLEFTTPQKTDGSADPQEPQVVFLSSPLARCIRTAECIAEGLGLKQGNIPFKIMVEESLVEGQQWVNYDLEHRDADQLKKKDHLPLWHGSIQHAKEFPTLHVRGQDSLDSVCCTTKVANPSNDAKCLMQDVVPVTQRCEEAGQFIFGGRPMGSKLSSGDLNEENQELLNVVRKAPVVFLLAHGETTALWAAGLIGYHTDHPYYTGCAELHRPHYVTAPVSKKDDCEEIEEKVAERQLNMALPFSTVGDMFHTHHLGGNLGVLWRRET